MLFLKEANIHLAKRKEGKKNRGKKTEKDEEQGNKGRKERRKSNNVKILGVLINCQPLNVTASEGFAT